MSCPKCGCCNVKEEYEYYDALISDIIDSIVYTCKDCGFVFRVKS